MESSAPARASATTFDVEQLVHLAWSGGIRVPHFQRGFRWNIEDVQRLFDSVVKGYPIGSLLLWKRPAAEGSVSLGDLQIDAPSMQDALWVVDGQQRVTSLANALHPEGGKGQRFALAYDLRSRDFARRPSAENPYLIPLSTLFDLPRLLRWFAEKPAVADYLDHATEVTRQLRQYEVPAYLVAHDDPKVLRDIFDRMNNYGKRLTRAEIFSALHAGEETSTTMTDLSFEKIAEDLDADLDFGLIDNNTVLASILATRGSDVRRDVRREFSGDGSAGKQAAYEEGAAAMRAAVSFLQGDAQVPHISFVAYKYLLVVLTRFFSLNPDPDTRTRRLLRRWYWRAAIVGPERFKGGTPNAARVLNARVQRDDASGSVLRLLEAVGRNQPDLDFRKFSTSDARTKVLLCAMWAHEPRDPATGEVFSGADLAGALAAERTARSAVVTLLPRADAMDELRQSPANRILAPGTELDGEELIRALTQPTLDGSPEMFGQVLASHLITDAAHRALLNGREQEFLSQRLDEVERTAQQFLDLACEWHFEDTPPISGLVLDDNADE